MHFYSLKALCWLMPSSFAVYYSVSMSLRCLIYTDNHPKYFGSDEFPTLHKSRKRSKTQVGAFVMVEANMFTFIGKIMSVMHS